MNPLSTLERKLYESLQGGGVPFLDAALIPVASANGGDFGRDKKRFLRAAADMRRESGITSGMGREETIERIFSWVTTRFAPADDKRTASFTLLDVLTTGSGNCQGLTTLLIALAEQFGLHLGYGLAVTNTLELHCVATDGERIIDPTINSIGLNAPQGIYVTVRPCSTAEVVGTLYADMSASRFGLPVGTVDARDSLLEKALLFSPQNPGVIILGISQARAVGQLNDSAVLEQLSATAVDYPGFAPYIMFQRALVLRGMGEIQQSLGIFAELALSYPTAHHLEVYKSEALEGLGQLAEAHQLLKNFLGSRPNSDPVHFERLINLELLLGRNEGVILNAEFAARMAETASEASGLPAHTRTAYRIIAANALVIQSMAYVRSYNESLGKRLPPNSAALMSAYFAARKALELFPNHPMASYMVASALRVAGADSHTTPTLWEDMNAAASNLLQLGDAALCPPGVVLVSQEQIGYLIKPLPVGPEELSAVMKVPMT